MDKSWINQHRLHPDYMKGVKEFVNLACERDRKSNQVTCPCKLCRNVKLVEKNLLGEHLMINGFLPNYTKWIFHGESSSSPVPESDSSENDDMLGMLHDAFGVPPPSLMQSMGEDSSNANSIEGMDEKTKNFFKLLKEYEKEVYPGCEKYSTLSFIVRLLHIKCLFGWSDKSFTVLLELLKDAFPKGETLPKSFYATRALLRSLGLDYYKVHACPKDCSIYWKETAERTDCVVCHTPRYKQFEGEESDANKKRHNVPQKIVRYFPLIPRLQSLYRTYEIASHMKWHVEGRTNDGKMRHPADTPVWKTYDNLYPDFGREPRNVRLGLAADGFNPFKSMNVSHSTWPVILIPYNLPPWLCMKQPYMMLSLLIDGPSSPGNNIDVYLRLVVDELKELWEVGVQTYDAASGQMFQMRAALLWTINDFPAFAMLSGWSTKGALACPCCHVYTRSLFLKNGRKFCYLAHRRWLDVDHPFREDIVSFEENKERIWREIKANTDADNSMKRRLISSTGKKWREWKCTVRRLHYKAFTNDPERLAHRPERVNEHQWRALVYYWGTRKAQKKSKKNTRIRKKKTLHHRTGRKPFAVVREEETVKNKGVPASRMQVWKASYLKDNMRASDAVNEVVTQMTELSTQREGSTESTCIDEEIFAQVMGPERPGRV